MKPDIHDWGPDADSCFRTPIMHRTYSAGFHYNTEYELICITSGSGTRFVGDDIRPFTAPDMVFMAPGLPHAWHNPAHPLPRTPSRPIALVALFKEDFLGHDFFHVPEMRPVRRLLRASDRGLHVGPKTRNRLVPRMHDLAAAKGPARLVLLLDILAALAEARDLRPMVSTAYHPNLTEPRAQRAAIIQKYILDHYHESILRDKLARLVDMNASSLSRFFKKVTRRTLVAFINEVRIVEACKRLTETDADIMSIACDCGYSSLSNFNRQFRRCKKMTPHEYRRSADTSN